MQPRLTTTSLSGMYVADVTQTVGFYNASVGVVFFLVLMSCPQPQKVFFFSRCNVPGIPQAKTSEGEAVSQGLKFCSHAVGYTTHHRQFFVGPWVYLSCFY